MGKLFGPQLQRFFRADEFLLGTLAGEQNTVRVLHRDREQQFFLIVVGLHYRPPISWAASAVPSTRDRIFAKAVSRDVETSSLKGENPQSSVVPSCSTGT